MSNSDDKYRRRIDRIRDIWKSDRLAAMTELEEYAAEAATPSFRTEVEESNPPMHGMVTSQSFDSDYDYVSDIQFQIHKYLAAGYRRLEKADLARANLERCRALVPKVKPGVQESPEKDLVGLSSTEIKSMWEGDGGYYLEIVKVMELFVENGWDYVGRCCPSCKEYGSFVHPAAEVERWTEPFSLLKRLWWCLSQKPYSKRSPAERAKRIRKRGDGIKLDGDDTNQWARTYYCSSCDLFFLRPIQVERLDQPRSASEISVC
jgi:hypothetical protein